jgi:hypothetical protein
MEELLDTGTTQITVKDIFDPVPTPVVVDGVADPGATGAVAGRGAAADLFQHRLPDYYEAVKAVIIGAFGETMVVGGMSPDAR